MPRTLNGTKHGLAALAWGDPYRRRWWFNPKMPLVSPLFARQAAFEDLVLGAVFRFPGLTCYQIGKKVEAPSRDAPPWILVLGGGTSGPYPSPWYGVMEDVRYGPVFPAQVRLKVGPTGPPVSQCDRHVIFPGDLVARRHGGFGIVIEGRLCIEAISGQRFNGEPSLDQTYPSWAMRYVEAVEEKILFQYPVPEGVVLR